MNGKAVAEHLPSMDVTGKKTSSLYLSLQQKSTALKESTALPLLV